MLSPRSSPVSLWLYRLVVLLSVLTFSWLTLQDQDSAVVLHTMAGDTGWTAIAQADD